jgi:threonine-phosphate decarboxylase
MIRGHGDDRYRYGDIRVDFSSNIPGGIDHTALREHLALHLADIGRYPEPEPYTLERELAAALGLDPAQVIATNGATEAIYLTAHLLAGSRTAIVEPTFAEYADACRLYGHRVVSPGEPYAPPAGCRTLWCCNPNNPTGHAWAHGRLLQTIDARPEITFVVDQSYEAFTRQPLLSAAEAAVRPNVILIHSMTKRYAIPGLRLGYLTASTAICDRLRRLRMPWSVNAQAIEAGRFLLREGVGGFSLDGMLSEAARLAGALRSMGVFHPVTSDTHFMLVEMTRGTAAELKEWLVRREGILIRNADNFPGLTPRHFRIAAGLPADNDLLISALERWSRH